MFLTRIRLPGPPWVSSLRVECRLMGLSRLLQEFFYNSRERLQIKVDSQANLRTRVDF
jgi:hypothetical protein